MCELLALSSSQPVRLNFSLQALAARGGATGRAHDGWGVAFYQGHDVALFREPAAAADSALVRFLESSGPATELAISHIRHATQGELSLANTQPFVRELGGRRHVFAHNGNLPGIYRSAALALDRYRPVGQTDSEHAFCTLLSRFEPAVARAEPADAGRPPVGTERVRARVACARAGQLPLCRRRCTFCARPSADADHRSCGTAGALDKAATLPNGRCRARTQRWRIDLPGSADGGLACQRAAHARRLAAVG